MDLTTRLEFTLTGNASKALDLAPDAAKAVIVAQYIDDLANGNGINQANQIYADSGSVAAGATVTFDLAGSLTDAFGDTITFTIVKAIVVKNNSAAAILNVGGGSNGAGLNAWDTWVTSTAADGSEQVILRPGAMLVLYTPDATGYAVTAGTVDILALEETGASVACAYELAVLGVV